MSCTETRKTKKEKKRTNLNDKYLSDFLFNQFQLKKIFPLQQIENSCRRNLDSKKSRQLEIEKLNFSSNAQSWQKTSAYNLLHVACI